MDSRFATEIVKYFRQKDPQGYGPITYLGAEQRFVGALRNSNVNNLEEQYLLGVDTYTVTYKDEHDNTIIEKSFHKNDIDHDSAIDYYKIISCIYKEGVPDDDSNYYFENDGFYAPYAPDDIRYGDLSLEYPNDKALYMINNNIFKTGENNDIIITLPSLLTIQKDELHFISATSDILVLTKQTKRKIIEENNTTKEVTYEIITNNLLDS